MTTKIISRRRKLNSTFICGTIWRPLITHIITIHFRILIAYSKKRWEKHRRNTEKIM